MPSTLIYSTNLYKNKYNKIAGYDFIPYVYIIKHIPTGLIYYGSKFSKSANPELFFKNYFTSSKIVHSLLESDGIDAFIFEIRRTFNTKEKCIEWERKVLRRMKVSSNEKFINLDENQTHFDNTGTTNISNPVTGKCIRVKESMPLPEGWVKGNINYKRSLNNKRLWFHDPDTGISYHVPENEKQAHWVSGRGRSYKSNSETLKKKELVSITDGKNNKFINKTELIPDGWRRGRTKSEEERKNNMIANMGTAGCFYINNGNINKRVYENSEIPEGWAIGRLNKKVDIV